MLQTAGQPLARRTQMLQAAKAHFVPRRDESTRFCNAFRKDSAGPMRPRLRTALRGAGKPLLVGSSASMRPWTERAARRAAKEAAEAHALLPGFSCSG